MEHPAVAEAGVIGKPDPVAGEIVKAFVALRAGTVASDELRLELIGFCSTRLGAAVAPREIEFDRPAPPHPEREDRPAPPQGSGARAGGGRHLDPGGGPVTDTVSASAGPGVPEPHPRPPPPARDGPDPPLRGALRRALQRHADPRLPPSRDRRGGLCRRRHGGTRARRRRGVHLPRARPRAGAGHDHALGHGRARREGRRVQPRTRRLDAPLRHGDDGSSAAMRSSAVASRWPSAWLWPTTCRVGAV